VLPSSKATSVKKQTVSVSITKDLVHYIDQDQVDPAFVESLLKKRLDASEDKVVVLRVEKGVPIEHAVMVMDIAYRNQYKIVLATQSE
jgi:biopolymer transport protein ExbD